MMLLYRKGSGIYYVQKNVTKSKWGSFGICIDNGPILCGYSEEEVDEILKNIKEHLKKYQIQPKGKFKYEVYELPEPKEK